MSSTASLSDDLNTFGAVVALDGVHNQPLPDVETIDQAVDAIFETIRTMTDATLLEAHAEGLSWRIVSAINNLISQISRDISENSRKRREIADRQTGSDIEEAELDRLETIGESLADSEEAFEHMLETARCAFHHHFGTDWQGRGSAPAGPRGLTAGVVSARDFEAARVMKWHESNLPPGPYVVFAGCTTYQDHDAIWNLLDKVLLKHPTMTLLHGDKAGADKIAAMWAVNRNVTPIRFLPEHKLGSRKVFERNDRMLKTLPIGVVVFPKDHGPTLRLAQNAKMMGLGVIDGINPANSFDPNRARRSQIPAIQHDEQPAEASNADADIEPTEPKSAISRATLNSLMRTYGLDRIAAHFDITLDTVKSWLSRGVPKAKHAQVFEMITSATNGQQAHA